MDQIPLSAGHFLIVWTIWGASNAIEERWHIYRAVNGPDHGQNLASGSHPGTRAEATQIGIDEAARIGLIKKD